METQTEIQSLQNAADKCGLIIHEYLHNDKRKKVKKYFAQLGKNTVSPTLDYLNLNMFLLGWIKSNEIKETQKKSC